MELKKLNRIYAAASLIFLAVLAISPAKDYFTEWRHYQKEYNKLLSAQPRRLKPVAIGIKQIWNEELDRVDRCISCHLGLEEQDLVGAEQPFTPHPRIYHDINEFGCTTCHNGQGLATTAEKAHDGRPYWEEPILPKEYIESSCGKCHVTKVVPEAPRLTYGRQLLEQYNCSGCHVIGNIPKTYAPRLDGIGDKTTWSWLFRWLKDPRAFRPETKMPDFKLSNEEAKLLADFLMTFKEYPNNRTLEPLPPELAEEYPPEDWVDLGKTRFREARCISCHLVEGRGGPLAPDLVKVASKAKPAWLYSYLLDPKGFQPEVPMPQYGFTKKEAQAVTAYMMSEFVDWEAPPDTLEHTPDPNFYEKGLKIFNEYNCGGCHKLAGIPKAENMGPDLSDIGDRYLYQLEFGNTDIPRTLPAYIYNKLKNPRQFLQTSRMPVYGFNEEQLKAITTALVALTKKERPQKYTVREKPPSTYEPQGAFGRVVKKYSCLSCHVINGRGFLLATDLSREGSQIQKTWGEQYFKIPYSMRPILTERMPNLFMSKEEIQTVVNYFDFVLRDDEMDSLRIALNDQNLINQGKRLFFDKYGCQSCHQLEGKGGYVGPPLDRTGDRLTAGWVYSWIKNPQEYYPETIEPNAGLTDRDAQAITAFLMSLKGE
jgi:mono/diheme cytochrome c family protein